MLKFLDFIYPRGGVRCMFEMPGKFNTYFSTTEQLCTALSAATAAGNDVYHACGTFKDGTSRKQHNAAGYKSFWVELDCGLDKHGAQKDYPDQKSAILALGQF